MISVVKLLFMGITENACIIGTGKFSGKARHGVRQTMLFAAKGISSAHVSIELGESNGA